MAMFQKNFIYKFRLWGRFGSQATHCRSLMYTSEMIVFESSLSFWKRTSTFKWSVDGTFLQSSFKPKLKFFLSVNCKQNICKSVESVSQCRRYPQKCTFGSIVFRAFFFLYQIKNPRKGWIIHKDKLECVELFSIFALHIRISLVNCCFL